MLYFCVLNAKQLLENIYKSKELKECLSRIRPVDIQQDVLQHTFTELLLKEEAFILDLAERNKLLPFITKMLHNMVRWERSSWTKTLSKEELTDNIPDKAQDLEDPVPDIPLNQLYWYEARILELYAEHGSYRKVEEITGISYVSIFNTVKKARINIKRKMDL